MEKYSVQPLDLMQFINKKYHEPFIHERIELEGTLDASRLIDSLDILSCAFPVLKCRYDEKENAFIPAENITGRNLLKVTDNDDKISLLTESLDMREKLIQFTLSDNALYITASHMICDGSGFKQLLYLFCDIYNGEFDENFGYLMNRDFCQLTAGLTGQSGMIVQMLLSMLENYKNKPVYMKGEVERPYVLEKTIPEEIMERAHAKARKQGATLNDCFLTAYARTLINLYGWNKVNIPCTVDLRKYAKEKAGIANLTGSYNLNIKIRTGEAFSESLSAVSVKMQKQKKTRNDIAGPALLVSKYEKSSLEEFLKLYGNMDTSQFTDYTNLGVLDAKRLVFKETTVKTAVGYSGMSKAPCFQLAVSSFRGDTTVSALSCCNESEKEKAGRIVAGVASEILAYAENPV